MRVLGQDFLHDLEAGRTIVARGEDALFIPASVAKVSTLLAALEILGPDHRFETSLWTVGHIRDGVLAGDLYLRGGGDPLLGTVSRPAHTLPREFTAHEAPDSGVQGLKLRAQSIDLDERHDTKGGCFQDLSVAAMLIGVDRVEAE